MNLPVDPLEPNRSESAAGPAGGPPEAGQSISYRLKFLPHYIHPDELPHDRWYPKVKPVLEWFLAALLLIPGLPLMLLSALAVKLTSRGPAFYLQVRLGKHGRPYTLIKIRTMRQDAELITGPQWSTPGDDRITPAGKFLRKTHLDELPQLFNVLRGEMSLVGPRPERPEIVPSLERAIPGYSQRLAVKPGVTGLAQVQLPADTDIASVRKKLSYDLYYVKKRGLWLDLRLIACTAFKVLGRSFETQRRCFALPQPEDVERISRLPLNAE